MTERDKQQEQMASHDYWSVTAEAAPEVQRRPVRHGATRVSQSVGERRTHRTVRRVVTMPEASPSDAFQSFYERRRRRQQRQHTWTRSRSQTRQRASLVPRTLSQTGVPAPRGLARLPQRPLPPQPSRIPVRSGKLRGGRRGFFWKLLGMLLMGGLVIVLVTFGITSTAFRIANIQVTGTQSSSLIRSIQEIGIQHQNIFLLNVTSLTERIAALPRVETIELSKQLPGSVTVHVTERQPVLLWQTRQGTFGIDEQGMVIAPASELVGNEHLSTIVDSTNRQQETKAEEEPQNATEPILRPGMRINGTDIVFAMDVMGRLPQVVSLTTFKLYYDGTMYTDTTRKGEVGPGSRGTFIIESPAGWKAFLGGPADSSSLDDKLIALREILNLVQQEQFNVATIDLRYGLRPVFTLQKE